MFSTKSKFGMQKRIIKHAAQRTDQTGGNVGKLYHLYLAYLNLPYTSFLSLISHSLLGSYFLTFRVKLVFICYMNSSKIFYLRKIRQSSRDVSLLYSSKIFCHQKKKTYYPTYYYFIGKHLIWHLQ